MSFKIRIPKVVAVDFTEGLASRLEYECGCVCVKTASLRSPAIWSYLERCDQHSRDASRASFRLIVEPNPNWPDWWGP